MMTIDEIIREIFPETASGGITGTCGVCDTPHPKCSRADWKQS